MPELSAAAEKKVLELKQAYIDSFPVKIQQLETYWKNIQVNQFAKSDLEELRISCHKLAGSSGSYEFHDISNAALKLEQLLQQMCSTDECSQEIELESEIEVEFHELVQLLRQ